MAHQETYRTGTILALVKVCGTPHLTAFDGKDNSARGWVGKSLYTRPERNIQNEDTFLALVRAHAEPLGFDIILTRRDGCTYAVQLTKRS